MSNKIHEIEVVKRDDTYLYLNVDQQLYRIRWLNCSSKLAGANQTEREYMEVSPSGYGLHWPLLDEDLAVTPLLENAEKLTGEFAANPS
jgi:hypothetical protein